MNKIIYGSAMAFGLALAGPAFAADIPVKAPPQPVYSGWGGWYVGVEVGAKWKTDDWTTDCVQQSSAILFACGTARNKVMFPGAPDASSPHKFKNSGLRTGGYIGANTQQQNWVYGIELDWAHYDRSDSVVGLVGATDCCNGGNPAFDRTSVTNKWDASLRLRAGYLVMPDVLLYGTGGIAFQQISATMSCAVGTLQNPGSPVCGFDHAQTNSDVLPGWTVGGGLEWKLLPNIILRGEYRYADFGSVRSNFFQGSGDVELLSRIHVRSQLATAGLAYKFDWWR